MVVVGDILPKTLGALNWRRLWPKSVGTLQALMAVLRPLVWLTRAATSLITGNQPRTTKVSEEEILAAAHLGARGGQISEMERDLIANIIQLEEIKAQDIMTPRTVMLSVDGNRPLSQVRAEARSWPHSRVPVYLGGQEEVVGYLLKTDLLTTNLDDDPPVSRLAKPAQFVPANANALNLLNAFLRHREHLRLVVDEYGGIMGLVTMEDVLESLVGREIVDEKDQVEDMQALARRMGQAVLGNGGKGDGE
jgi:CBS domain containing-hemolysin-like protein